MTDRTRAAIMGVMGAILLLALIGSFAIEEHKEDLRACCLVLAKRLGMTMNQ